MHVDGDKAQVLRAAGIIVIDKAPLSGKKVVEAVRSLLEGIDGVGDGEPRPRLIVYSGEFQQIAPVVPFGDCRQQVNAWLSMCEWWRYEDGPADDDAAPPEPGDEVIDLDDLRAFPRLPKGVHRMSLADAADAWLEQYPVPGDPAPVAAEAPAVAGAGQAAPVQAAHDEEMDAEAAEAEAEAAR